MPIADWFKARESRNYTSTTDAAARADMPDGVWVKCDSCKHIIYEGELVANGRVCRHCGHHFALSAPERIASLVDENSFVEMDAGLTPGDPLSFSAAKPYSASLDKAREQSGLPEAIVTGRAMIGGRAIVIGAMDFRFVGASMGSVVGEKVARAFEAALADRTPIVFVISSGGARMQEGMLSLMQMAKTSAAAARLSGADLPYISVLADPTYGGVTASFPVLADVILAEPGARIGFTGPRIIEQTIRQKLPKGFQTSEFMLEHGMIDAVVPRTELRDTLALLLAYLGASGDTAKSAAEGGER